MIFVTVGNLRLGFPRLLEAVDRLAAEGSLGECPVLVQSGHTRFATSRAIVKPFLSLEEFERSMDEAELIISHGGCGSILHAVRRGKVPVVVPRLKRFSEHVNDHQLELVHAMAEEHRILPVFQIADLGAAVQSSLETQVRLVPPPPSPMCSLVREALLTLLNGQSTH